MFFARSKAVSGSLFFLAAHPLFAGSDLINVDTRGPGLLDGRWSVSVAPSWRQLGELSLRGGSRSTDADVPDLFTGDSLNDPLIGPADSFGERRYNNGFVRPSGFTDATSMTSFWSYQNSSQVTATTIQFNATGTRSEFLRSPSSTSAFRDHEDLTAFTPQIDLIFRPTHKPAPLKNLAGVLFSLSFGGADDSSKFMNFSGSQTSNTYQRTFNDTYLLGGLQGNVPPAGFEGTFAGPGPLIPNIPEDRSFSESLATSDVALISNDVRSQVDLSSLSLAAGPMFEGQLAHRLSWQLAFGTTFTLYDWDTKQDESLNTSIGGVNQVLATYRDRNSGTDFSLGVFARATAVYDLNEQWFVNSFLQGEVATSFEMKAGPSKYKFEPGGFSLGFGLGRQF